MRVEASRAIIIAGSMSAIFEETGTNNNLVITMKNGDATVGTITLDGADVAWGDNFSLKTNGDNYFYWDGNTLRLR